MISSIISRLVILVFGTLYPAYASYKAVKSKSVKEYVKWMMYWIVFALFTCAETITDVFLSWFPFYYEIKIILVIWLLSPATKGSSFLYRKFVHPMLSSKEQEIDDYILKAKEQSYKQVFDLGTKGVNVLMQTALKGGGGLVNQIKKSYSLSDLSDRHSRDEDGDETDISDPRLLRKRQSPRRTPTTSMYFSEIDIRSDPIVSVQSAEDLSSGYSSSEGLVQTMKLQAREALVRTGSIGSKTRPTRVTRSSVVTRKIEEADEEVVSNEDDDEYTTYTITQSDPLNSKESSSKFDKISDSSSDGDYEDPIDFDLTKPNQTGNSDEITIPKTIEAVSTSLIKIDVPEVSETNQRIPEYNRAGKYHKKAAPPIPSTIKATLVLKPGIVKPLLDENKEVFCHSPKLKRKSRSKSPSPTLEQRNRSRSKSPALKMMKNKSPLLGKRFECLMNFPKKIGLFKHDGDNQKRSSWYDGINLHASKTSLEGQEDSLMTMNERLKISGSSKIKIDQKRLKENLWNIIGPSKTGSSKTSHNEQISFFNPDESMKQSEGSLKNIKVEDFKSEINNTEVNFCSSKGNFNEESNSSSKVNLYEQNVCSSKGNLDHEDGVETLKKTKDFLILGGVQTNVLKNQDLVVEMEMKEVDF